MAQYITYKLPRTRSVSKFIVYPHAAGAKVINLQSDNHCIIVYPDDNEMWVSKRFAQYPTFTACSPKFGAKCMEIPGEIREQLAEIRKHPAGKTVTIVG